MSTQQNREGRVFIFIVAALCVLILAGGVYFYSALKEKDYNSLQMLYDDYKTLEQVYKDEIRKIDEGALPYQSPETQRQDLTRLLTRISSIKDEIYDTPEKARANMEGLIGEKRRFESKIAQFYNLKDDYTIQELAKMRNEINTIKKQLTDSEAKYKRVISQLNSAIAQRNRYKGKAEKYDKEIAELEKAKARLDSLYSAQRVNGAELDSLVADRDRLKELLAKSDELYRKQQEELSKLKDITSQAYNFKAEYEYRKVRVPLDNEGKHTRSRIDKEIFIDFEVGPSVFEEGDDSRIVYLTLFREGAVYRTFSRIPVRVGGDNKGTYKLELDKRLDDGNYFFMLTYKENPILENGYGFTVR